ncbi:MAG: sulfite exporter TauE/SafE family protein [Candidatus Bathyarchaeota archaeon]|nr:MAG: sulfite exporter TauE/SafE family protein [Candidatus Bathyarchaeota archaeon]
MDLLTTIIVLFGGLLAGILNTVMGGGSLISVPLLITTGLPAHLAIGTNRLAMIFNTGVGAIEYHKKVKYRIELALFLAAFTSVGSLLGASIALQINEEIMRYVIAVLMLIMGGVVFYKKKLGLEQREVKQTRRTYVLISLLSLLLGVYGGFFGAGVSTMFTFLFVSFLGMSFIGSAGITRFIVSIMSMVAVSIFLINDKIDFFYGVLLAASFVVGAKIGVKLALKAGNIWIRRVFLLFVVISSLRLLFL